MFSQSAIKKDKLGVLFQDLSHDLLAFKLGRSFSQFCQNDTLVYKNVLFYFHIMQEYSALHYLKRCPSYSGPYFPAFGLNTEKYFEYGEILLSLRIQFECGKIWTRTTPNTDTFQPVLNLKLEKPDVDCRVFLEFLPDVNNSKNSVLS